LTAATTIVMMRCRQVLKPVSYAILTFVVSGAKNGGPLAMKEKLEL
jgi:hypothetical protein